MVGLLAFNEAYIVSFVDLSLCSRCVSMISLNMQAILLALSARRSYKFMGEFYAIKFTDTHVGDGTAKLILNECNIINFMCDMLEECY